MCGVGQPTVGKNEPENAKGSPYPSSTETFLVAGDIGEYSYPILTGQYLVHS